MSNSRHSSASPSGRPRILSLAAGLCAVAAAGALAGWLGALRVSRHAIPQLPARELASLAGRGAWPLLAAGALTAAALWAISAARSSRAGAEPPRACASGFVLAAETIAGWIAAMALLCAASFDIKVGWIAGALLVGSLAGLYAGRLSGKWAAARPALSGGGAAVVCGLLCAAAWAPIAPAVFAGRAAGAPPGAKLAHPNVVLIVVDALRADHLGAYGYERPTSPVLDALASTGTLFEKVVAPSSWTLPSMASIFTSSEPGRNGTIRRGDTLPGDAASLPAIMKEAGYQTAGFAPNPWLKRTFGFQRGFDAYYDIDRLGLSRLLAGVRLKNMVLKRLGRIRVEPELVAGAPDLTRRALSWLAARRADVPFFLYLHFMDVHSPYNPPPPFHGRFCSGHHFDLPDHLLESRFRSHKTGPDPAIRDHVVELYDESILALDASIGDLLEGLRSMGLSKDTIVLFTADHGEEFLDHGETMHGRSLYQEVTRVPLIASGEGIPAGRVVSERVTTLDLLPTLIDLAGAEARPGLEGESLRSVFATGAAPVRTRPLGSQLLHEGKALTSLFVGDEKTIFTRPASRAAKDEGSVQVFDVSVDPGERHDLAKADPEAASRLRLAAMGVEALWGIPGAKNRPPGERIDPETLEQLEALGYLN